MRLRNLILRVPDDRIVAALHELVENEDEEDIDEFVGYRLWVWKTIKAMSRNTTTSQIVEAYIQQEKLSHAQGIPQATDVMLEVCDGNASSVLGLKTYLIPPPSGYTEEQKIYGLKFPPWQEWLAMDLTGDIEFIESARAAMLVLLEMLEVCDDEKSFKYLICSHKSGETYSIYPFKQER